MDKEDITEFFHLLRGISEELFNINQALLAAQKDSPRHKPTKETLDGPSMFDIDH